jgi:4-amino-4-deoxy-L-arabinose transferase-like glycosyltransferase
MSVVTPTPLYDPALDSVSPPDAETSARTPASSLFPASAPARRPGLGVERGSLIALLAATAVLYLWDLGASGYANSFYSAAAQAGSQNWTAWFFGSLDSGNAITVDKPPAALWVMGLSVRLFGLNAWSILVPEALMGVATTWLVYATVRRTLTRGTIAATLAPTPRLADWAALAGAAISALTPAAVLMFRFNNPDALLVLLLTLATYATVRASENGSRRWLVGAGVAVGFAFLTKMLQAFVILPALVVAYAIAAPIAWKRKLVDLLAAFAAVIASTAWYIVVFQLTPASMRPYMGGSQTNSFLELAFGYNGFGRITGTEVGSVGGGVQRGPNSGTGGLLRLFTTVSGGMVSWLIPAALILSIFAFVTLFGRRRAASAVVATGGSHRPANRLVAGGLAAFAGTLIITGVVFSLMEGIYHDYYTVALAPAIGGTVAIAGAVAWAHRDWLVAVIGLSAASIVTGVWSYALASQAGGVYTIVGYAAAAVGILAGLGLLFADRLPGLVASGTILAALAAGLAGPLAYSLNTAATPHTGSIVTAGPVSGGMGGGQPSAGGFGGQAGRQRGNGTFVPGQAPAGAPGGGGQGFPGQAGTGQAPTGTTRGGAAGGMGGLLNGAQVSEEMKSLLLANADSYTWVGASVGSQNAASYQLATNKAVMAIGGFNGSDPSPTLDQFKALVAAGKIHYFIGGGSFGGQNGGSQAASEISSWVQSTFTAQTVGSTTVYDLTQAK